MQVERLPVQQRERQVGAPGDGQHGVLRERGERGAARVDGSRGYCAHGDKP
jgi:hypothetical protein